MDFSERLLKGQIVAAIVSEMFRESGYTVYRVGYQEILADLPELGEDIVAEKLRTMPDLLVVRDGEASFVEVKSRAGNGSDLFLHDWVARAVRFWPEARLVLVRPTPPHFWTATVEELASGSALEAFERGTWARIPREFLDKYGELVARYGFPASLSR
jgi:hypothetical protein